MKLFPLSLLFLLAFSACGPAAEDRQLMHSRAKVFQDSIANALRMAMAEAEVPGNAPAQPDTASQSLRPQTTTTVK